MWNRRGADDRSDREKWLELENEKLWKLLFAAVEANESFGNYTFSESARLTVMPKTVTSVGATGQATFTEFAGLNQTGAVVPPSGPITYASDNVAVATVDQTGLITAVGANGVANITGVDKASVNQVAAGDTFTVNIPAPPPVALSASLAIA